MPGRFFYGDAHEVIPKFIRDGSVDFVYCDPPWSSSREHNHFWTDSEAQGRAYEETWSYARRHMDEFAALCRSGHRCVGQLNTWHEAISGACATLDPTTFAYLTFMASRLIDAERSMREGASLIFHCDEGVSRYVGQLLDHIFPFGFIREVTWQRHTAHNDGNAYGNIAEKLLWYVKGNGRSKPSGWIWNPQYIPYTDEEREGFDLTDHTGRGPFRANTLHADGRPEPRRFRPRPPNTPFTDAEDKSKSPPRRRSGQSCTWGTQDRIDRLDRDERIYYGVDGRAQPRIKEYLYEMPGKALQNIWTDLVPPINSNERAYATSKPARLLARILASHTNPGSLILDPFCGGGTTLQAADMLGRPWIGIDVAYEALDPILRRLDGADERATFDAMLNDEETVPVTCEVTGYPSDMRCVRHLIETDPMGFQWWAVDRAGGRPPGGRQREKTPRRDGGMDGEILTTDGQIIIGVGARDGEPRLRQLCQVMTDNNAKGVIMISGHPSSDARDYAVTKGFISSSDGRQCPKVQVFTPEDMLQLGWRGPELHGRNITPPTPWV